MNKTCVIFHSVDLDGWMSAAIVKHWFIETHSNYHITDENKGLTDKNNIGLKNHSLHFLGYNYGDPIPDLSEYDKIIMCDISFPKEEMLRLWYNIDQELIWIDHHVSAINDNSHLVWKGLQDTKYAACELTWKYFFPESKPDGNEVHSLYKKLGGHGIRVRDLTESEAEYEKEVLQHVKSFSKGKNKMPEIVRLLGRYDCFGSKGTDEEQKVLEFQYGARSRITNYEEAYSWLISSIEKKKIYGIEITKKQSTEDYLMKFGSIIYQYLCTEAKQFYKNGFEISLVYPIKNTSINNDIDRPGVNATSFKVQLVPFKFICINKERFNPINFGIDYHSDGYDGAACFHKRTDGKWSFSLYNDNGKVDCSVIAKEFGGGGHKGAAGFTCDDNTMMNLIKHQNKQKT
jgi:oligoribonuclease NrnB/cAMP/cGMP phosphodiesterase (DHH superfamily)